MTKVMRQALVDMYDAAPGLMGLWFIYPALAVLVLLIAS